MTAKYLTKDTIAGIIVLSADFSEVKEASLASLTLPGKPCCGGFDSAPN